MPEGIRPLEKYARNLGTFWPRGAFVGRVQTSGKGLEGGFLNSRCDVDGARSMFLFQLRAASGILAIGMITVSAFVVAAGPSPGTPDGPPAPVAQMNDAATPAGLFAPEAWRSEPYRPPDFAGFFPDDPAGARALAALWDEVKPEMEHQAATPNVPGRTPWWSAQNRRSDDEILQMVRRGLRRIDGARRTWVIRWIGVRYIPPKRPQNPAAIEILYHATVVVPVKAYTGSLDRPIERRGLEPDVEVRCTASDLSRGRDTVLETAAEWLRQNGHE
jgi:hypothetical protein